jgi:hypothetical protein
LAQYLVTLLRAYAGKIPCYIRNSMEFINIMSLHAGPEVIVVSFDVILCFTMVTNGQALHLLSQHFDDIMRFFRHILTSPFCRFNR